MRLLYKNTNDSRYKKHSLNNFSAWEEIKLTEILKKHVIITNFPILEIPFYHNYTSKKLDDRTMAENADMILYSYREVLGSGVRISDPKILYKKARIFNLPIKDYMPYLEMRKLKNYKKSAGFGLGWQRYVHWLLKLPHIWEACIVPRDHQLPKI